MNLQLAVAEVCTTTSCRVRYVHDRSMANTRYASPVQDQIKVRPGDLVAVDTDPAPPEVVWRWWHGVVERVTGDRALVSRNITQDEPDAPRRTVIEVAVPSDLDAPIAPGDAVFFHGGDNPMMVDVARNGTPANPARLAAVMFPTVSSTYERLSNT